MRFHIVKRDAFPLWKRLTFYLGAVVIALLLGAVVLMAIGVNPVDYYWRMFTMGMVGNKIAYRAFENYLKVFASAVRRLFSVEIRPNPSRTVIWPWVAVTMTRG